ncbi:AMP-binding protein [Sinorhizobium medicae]|nr:AMP-binding protein [Sinorhizobium medicae]
MTVSSWCVSDPLRDARRTLERLAARGVALWCDAGELCLRAPRGILTDEDLAWLRRNKPQILRLLCESAGIWAAGTPLSATPEQELLLRAGGGAGYIVSGLFALQLPVPWAPLTAALEQVLRRHDAFRLCLAETRNSIAGFLFAARLPPVRILDFTGLGPESCDGALRAFADAEARRPFDLGRGPPLRVCVALDRGRAVAVVLSAHHVAMDRWSMDLLGAELTEAIAAAERGRPWTPPPAASFAAAMVERRSAVDAGFCARATRDARRAMSDSADALDLHGRRELMAPRTPAMRAAGVFPGALRARLTGSPRPAAVLLAALATVLRRHCDGERLRLGMPVARRPDLRAQATIGLLATTVPIVLRVRETDTAAVLIKAAAEALDAAIDRQDADMSEALAGLTVGGLSPFDVIVSFQAASATATTLFCAEPSARSIAKCDLVVFLDERGAIFEYPEGIGDARAVGRIADDFVEIASRFCGAQAGDTIALLDPPPRWASPLAPAPDGVATLAGLVAAQARRAPDAIALADWSFDPPRLLTYHTLALRTARIAAALAARGIGPERRVGLLVTGATARVVSALAVLWAGGAYVPIDRRWPPERVRVASTGLDLVLIDADGPALKAHAPTLTLAAAEVEGDAPARAPVAAPPGALAYILHTSGSTGEPKAVAIERRNAAALITWAAQAYDFSSLRRVLAITPLSFDLSVFEMFAPFAAAGTIACLESPLDAARRLSSCEPTLVNTTPSIAREIFRAGALLPAGATVNLAGEPFGPDLVCAAYKAGAARLFNLYGPSETTTYSSFAEIAPELTRGALIGRPIAGSRVRLGDGTDPAAPARWRGEIVIGGGGVSRGYIRCPHETAARFLPDSDGGPGARAFWSGDRGSVGNGSGLDFLGRRDRQMKRRGVRIELDEIESMLLTHPRVAAVAALLREDGEGGRLVAFVAPTPGPPPDPDALAAALPSYMAPDEIHMVAALPKTASGKIDRAALDLVRFRPSLARPPETAREAAVAAIWASIVGREIRDRNARFFEVGGDSLKLMHVAERLNRCFGVNLSPTDLLRNPTVAETAQLLPAGVEAGVGADGGDP